MKFKVINKNKNIFCKMFLFGMFVICVLLDDGKIVDCAPTPSTATLQSSLAAAILPSLQPYLTPTSTDQYGNVVPIGNPAQNSKIVDMNNPDPTILATFGLSNENLTAIKQKQNDFKAKNRLNQNATVIIIQEPGEFKRNDTLNPSFIRQTQFEENLLKSIKDGMEQILLRNTTNQPTRPIPSDAPTHDISVYPNCNPPRNTNDTYLANSDTWNLYYTPPATIPNRYVSSAILRLFKIIPANDRRTTTARNVNSGQVANGNSSDCSPPNDDLIRITISVYIKKNRKERRKRMCSSIMISKSFHGWIELDVKSAVKLWEKQIRNVGLAVDVQDQDENILHAADYFVPADCASNEPAIPWNFYRDQLAYNATQMEQLPRFPRLDVQVIDYPFYSERHFPHHFHHHHHHNNQRRVNTENNLYQMDEGKQLGNHLTGNEATTDIMQIAPTTITTTLAEDQAADQLKMPRKRHLEKNHYHHDGELRRQEHLETELQHRFMHLYHQQQELHRLQQRQEHHNNNNNNQQHHHYQQQQQHHNIPLNYQHHQRHYHQQNYDQSGIVSSEDNNESIESENNF